MNRCCLSLSFLTPALLASAAAAEPVSNAPRKFPILSVKITDPAEEPRHSSGSRFGLGPLDRNFDDGQMGARERTFSISQDMRIEGRPVTLSIGSAKRISDPVRIYPEGRLDHAGNLGSGRTKPRGRTLQATARIRF